MDKDLKNGLMIAFGIAGIANIAMFFINNILILEIVKVISAIMLLSISAAIFFGYTLSKKVSSK